MSKVLIPILTLALALVVLMPVAPDPAGAAEATVSALEAKRKTNHKVLRLKVVDRLWTRFVTPALQGGAESGLTELREFSPVVLREMNAAVGDIEATCGAGLLHPGLAKVINVAGRQHMLIQKAVSGPALLAPACRPKQIRRVWQKRQACLKPVWMI